MKTSYLKKATAVMVFAITATAAVAGTAFLKGEQVSGMNKICYYEHLGSVIAITIGSTELCPLSIDA